MPSSLRQANTSMQPPNVRRAQRSQLKKRFATIRFHLARSPLGLVAAITATLIVTTTLLLRLSVSFITAPKLVPLQPQPPPLQPPQLPPVNPAVRNQKQQEQRQQSSAYVDPCLSAEPIRLLHFDPATRYSRDVPKTLPQDSDPSGRARIFTTFFKAYLFEPASDIVVSLNSTSRVHRMDVNSGIRIAQQALRRYYNDTTLSISSYSLGYTHLDRVHGSRHIFHLHTRNATVPSQRHVVAIQRTFDNSCHVSVRDYESSIKTSVPVYLVVPYATRPHRLAWFLSQFESLMGSSHQIRLLLAVCKHNFADLARARELVDASDTRDHISVVPVPGDRTKFFSRAISIREAARLVPPDAIMFITDIDMYIFPSMFDACRFNAIQGSQVYFPVFYSLYARYSRIGRNAGYWRDSSLGMSCMYRTDFDAVAAYEDAERKFVGWGSEDRVLSMAFIRDPQYEIFRAVEPALRHKWHLKRCEPFTPAYEDCLAVMFQQLGQMSSVGRYLLKKKFDVQKYYVDYVDEDDDVLNDSNTGNSTETDKEEEELKKRRELFLKKNHELIKLKREMIAKQRKEKYERQKAERQEAARAKEANEKAAAVEDKKEEDGNNPEGQKLLGPKLPPENHTTK